MWDLIISHADKHDTAMVERLKDDMDGILVYVRFYSVPWRIHPIYLSKWVSRQVYSPRLLLHLSSKVTSP